MEHNDVILIAYEASKNEDHDFVKSIVNDYLQKYIEVTNKKIFKEFKYLMGKNLTKNFSLFDFFYYCFAAKGADKSSELHFTVKIDDNILNIDHNLKIEELYFVNMVKKQNIVFIDNCIVRIADFGPFMEESKIFFPKNISINRNYIILLLEFKNLEFRNKWNQKNFLLYYNQAKSQNMTYFSFDSFELGTSLISQNTSNYNYSFDKFVFEKTQNFKKTFKRQIHIPYKAIEKSYYLKNIYDSSFINEDYFSGTLNKFKITFEEFSDNKSSILADLNFFTKKITLELLLTSKEIILDGEKFLKKIYI
ncbi:hypothetical protein GVAV_000360 [Gurleya vavrai]